MAYFFFRKNYNFSVDFIAFHKEFKFLIKSIKPGAWRTFTAFNPFKQTKS